MGSWCSHLVPQCLYIRQRPNQRVTINRVIRNCTRGALLLQSPTVDDVLDYKMLNIKLEILSAIRSCAKDLQPESGNAGWGILSKVGQKALVLLRFSEVQRIDVLERAPVAQRIEQRFPKPCVGRSSRPRGTLSITVERAEGCSSVW